MNTSDNSVNSAFGLLVNQSKKIHHYIYQDKVLIGRNKDAFISLCDARISRNHCSIERTENGKFFICDMSTLGTFVNGQKLLRERRQELKNRDEISLVDDGSYSYTFFANPKMRNNQEDPQKLSTHSHLTKKMIDLNSSQIVEKENLNKKIADLETERCSLVEIHNIMALQSRFEKDELESTSSHTSVEQPKEDVDRKLKKDVEETNLLGKRKSKEEVEEKIAKVMKKVEELQKTKNEMETRHQMEREEMEKRCRSEVEELKKKLAESEAGQEKFQLQLQEIKTILSESEIEQQRLFDEKVQAEKELESKVQSLTQECEKKSKQLRDLETKYKMKEEEEKARGKAIECLEDEIQCTICAELYIEPTSLSCGHLFCKFCIDQWKKKKNVCPMCRSPIGTSLRMYTMDSIIERNVQIMPKEVKLRRDALIIERQKVKPKGPAKKKKKCNNDPPLPGSSRTQARDAIVEPHIQEPVIQDIDPERDHDDPFRAGWVTNVTSTRRRPTADRNSPITLAAIDLTVFDSPRVPSQAPNLNGTIDLTNT